MATYHGDLLMANYFAGGARGGRSDRAAAARARGTTYYGYVWLFMATYNGYTCCGYAYYGHTYCGHTHYGHTHSRCSRLSGRATPYCTRCAPLWRCLRRPPCTSAPPPPRARTRRQPRSLRRRSGCAGHSYFGCTYHGSGAALLTMVPAES